MLRTAPVFDTTDATMEAITDAGFVVPQRLQKLPSNALKTKHYDQIAFVAPQLENHLELSAAGVFDLYTQVYRDGDEEAYAGEESLRAKIGERATGHVAGTAAAGKRSPTSPLKAS